MERGTEYQNFSSVLYEQPDEIYPSMKLEQAQKKVRFSQWKLVDYDGDGDGDLDLLVNSVNVSLLENMETRNGMVIFRDRGPLSGLKLAGHTTSPAVVDWNGNGIPDLLVGTEDGLFYYAER